MENSIQVNRTIFVPFILLLFLLTISACTKSPSQNKEGFTLSPEDIEQIKEISKDYTAGWLENDSEKVLGLYADSATIIPSGLMPLQGKKAITDFWFPNDSSKTIIHYYDLEILDISGTSNMAYTYENGKLSFTYEKGDFKMDREAESYAITIYKKNTSGEWKITKRIWTDMK
ncbi:MAG: nuclear transport factor 2 family protein [Bacteroidetes bacterium]|nr:MAG: nuclear transport factor 2 family protein [Bacteroidota bacterium]